MFVLFKVIIGFILTYLTIFGITVIVTKVVDNWRINKDKIDYIPKNVQQKSIDKSVKNEDKSQNLKWNDILGVWEE